MQKINLTAGELFERLVCAQTHSFITILVFYNMKAGAYTHIFGSSIIIQLQLVSTRCGQSKG